MGLWKCAEGGREGGTILRLPLMGLDTESPGSGGSANSSVLGMLRCEPTQAPLLHPAPWGPPPSSSLQVTDRHLCILCTKAGGWKTRELGSSPVSMVLCDLGEVTSPLWALVCPYVMTGEPSVKKRG